MWLKVYGWCERLFPLFSLRGEKLSKEKIMTRTLHWTCCNYMLNFCLIKKILMVININQIKNVNIKFLNIFPRDRLTETCFRDDPSPFTSARALFSFWAAFSMTMKEPLLKKLLLLQKSVSTFKKTKRKGWQKWGGCGGGGGAQAAIQTCCCCWLLGCWAFLSASHPSSRR